MTTIEERLREESFPFPDSTLSGDSQLVISFTDAIRIAKEYATEMCKRQREICANSSFKIHELGLADILPEREREQMNKIIGRMITAQLATEEE